MNSLNALSLRTEVMFMLLSLIQKSLFAEDIIRRFLSVCLYSVLKITVITTIPATVYYARYKALTLCFGEDDTHRRQQSSHKKPVCYNDGKFDIQIGADLTQINQICDFLWSVSVHFGSRGSVTQGCQIWHRNSVRLAPNGTHMGLFKNRRAKMY